MDGRVARRSSVSELPQDSNKKTGNSEELPVRWFVLSWLSLDALHLGGGHGTQLYFFLRRNIAMPPRASRLIVAGSGTTEMLTSSISGQPPPV